MLRGVKIIWNVGVGSGRRLHPLLVELMFAGVIPKDLPGVHAGERCSISATRFSDSNSSSACQPLLAPYSVHFHKICQGTAGDEIAFLKAEQSVQKREAYAHSPARPALRAPPGTQESFVHIGCGDDVGSWNWCEHRDLLGGAHSSACASALSRRRPPHDGLGE